MVSNLFNFFHTIQDKKVVKEKEVMGKIGRKELVILHILHVILIFHLSCLIVRFTSMTESFIRKWFILIMLNVLSGKYVAINFTHLYPITTNYSFPKKTLIESIVERERRNKDVFQQIESKVCVFMILKIMHWLSLF